MLDHFITHTLLLLFTVYGYYCYIATSAQSMPSTMTDIDLIAHKHKHKTNI